MPKFIDLNHLQEYSAGCFDSAIENGAWRALRLPASMRPLYVENEGSRARMECSSSVRLRFSSDTTRIRLTLRYGVAVREQFKGSLVVDGAEYSSFGPEQAPEAPGEWSGEIFSASEKRARVFDLWLPHLCRADVRAIELDEGAQLQAAPPLALRWLAYGDSITQGMTSSTPLQTHYARCALALDAEVCNLGVGGARLIPQLAGTIPDGEFDLVSIAYGTNDFNQDVSVEEYSRSAQSLLKALREKWLDCPIVLITPLTWVGRYGANATGKTLADYRAALVPVAAAVSGVTLVAGETLVPDDDANFVDKVHPGDAGFRHYATNLLPHLRDALGINHAA